MNAQQIIDLINQAIGKLSLQEALDFCNEIADGLDPLIESLENDLDNQPED